VIAVDCAAPSGIAAKDYLAHHLLALSPALCAQLLRHASEHGFAPASLDYPASYRNNERLVLDEPELAQQLENVLAPLMPPILLDANGATWHAQNLNPRLRWCRYHAGQQFYPHQDGVYQADADTRSWLSVVIYLDAPPSFTGGDTVFYQSGPHPSAVIQRIVPSVGSVLVLDHQFWHAGELVRSGLKHVLRSDWLYQRQPLAQSNQKVPALAHTGYVYRLLCLPGGAIASAGRDGAVKLWRQAEAAQELTPLCAVPAARQSIAALAIAGDYVISASRDRSISLLNYQNLMASAAEPHINCHSHQHAHAAAVLGLATIGDDEFLSADATGEIAHWRIGASVKLRCVQRWQAHAGWIWQLLLLRNKSAQDFQVLSISEDGSLRGSHAAGCKALFQCEQPLRAMAMQSNGDAFDTPRLLLADQLGTLYLLQARAPGNSAWPAFELVQQGQPHSAAVRSVRALANGGWLSAAEDGQILQHSADLQSVKRLAQLDNFACDALLMQFDSLGLAPQSSPSTLICAGYDGLQLRRII
jgi:WD40 repeat protein